MLRQYFGYDTRQRKRLRIIRFRGLGNFVNLPEDLLFTEITGFADIAMLLELSLVSKGWKQLLSCTSKCYPTWARVYELPCAVDFHNQQFHSFEDLVSTYCPLDYDYDHGSILANTWLFDRCLPAVVIFNCLRSCPLWYCKDYEDGLFLCVLINYITKFVTLCKVGTHWKSWVKKYHDSHLARNNINDMIILTVDIFIDWLWNHNAIIATDLNCYIWIL